MSLRVLDPGLYTLIVNGGRPGHRSQGVPVGGAADRCSLAIGNALVGNSPAAPALEITWTGPTLQAEKAVACVVYGAPFPLQSDRQRLQAGTTFSLNPGETVQCGTARRGLRAYFCVAGGFQVPCILGSALSLEPVADGAVLPCQAGDIGGRFLRMEFSWQRRPLVLRVLNGPQAGWFAGAHFARGEYRVSSASDRMGLRLEGPPLAVPKREMVSEPVCPGAVQVTREGQCIILGVEGQTIGGYPQIAQVIQADLGKLGQLRPGSVVRFERVDLAEAETAYHAQQTELEEWLTRLRETEDCFRPAALVVGMRSRHKKD